MEGEKEDRIPRFGRLKFSYLGHLLFGLIDS